MCGTAILRLKTAGFKANKTSRDDVFDGRPTSRLGGEMHRHALLITRPAIVGMFRCTRLVYTGYPGLKPEARLRTFKTKVQPEE